MSPLAIVLMVVGILVLVAGINLAIWIPILRKLKRLPALLREELAGEQITLGPERTSYLGATAEYGRAGGISYVALTTQRLVIRKGLGRPVDVPVDRITGVHEATSFFGRRRVGRRVVIVETSSGAKLGFYFASNEPWLHALREIAERRATP